MNEELVLMTDLQRQDAKSPRRQEPGEDVDALAHAVIGAALEVHKTLGPGYPESIYEEALCHELMLKSIPFERQHSVPVSYKGHHCGEGRLDLWVDRKLIVELKAVEQVLSKHKAQGKAYLVATRCQLALVINFNEALLKDGIHRIVYTP